MIRIAPAAGIALACSGSQHPETRSDLATVSVPAPKSAEAPDASSTPAPEAAEPEPAEPEASEAGAAIGLIGAPAAVGGLDKDVIRRVIQRHAGRIRYCYQKELVKDPALTAKASPRFTIATDGTVAQASLAQSSGVAALDSCILTVIRSMQFPAFDGGVVVVTYPFIFAKAQ